MLILLNEMDLFEKSNVYATDINADVLDTARSGIYRYRFNVEYLSNFDAVIRENPRDHDAYYEVPYSKYFTIDKSRDYIRMNDSLLEKPVYRKMDLVTDPNPFDIQYDLIVCRNVIIYFNYELQNKVFKLFLDSMNQESVLILGVHVIPGDAHQDGDQQDDEQLDRDRPVADVVEIQVVEILEFHLAFSRRLVRFWAISWKWLKPVPVVSLFSTKRRSGLASQSFFSMLRM